MHIEWRQRHLLAASTFLLALGAGFGGRDAGQASRTAGAAPTSPRNSGELDLCKLMPVTDVTRILSATVGVAVTWAQPHVGGMCSYRDVKKGPPRVRLLIDFTDHGAPSRARTALASLRAMFRERGFATADVAGLGDEAFAASDGDTEGVKVRRRGYVGQVNLSVDDASAAAVREAAKRLAAETVARLP